MSQKKQFDELLGGSEKLPHDAHIMKLFAARASEIAAVTYSIENPQQTKLIFQKLPVHMRRRVMSHNAKRMPRKLRMGHLSQMAKSGLPPKSKRPSRKFRRRPNNLLLEYNRRQKSKYWLETHIWHAKRFKMIEKWGMKIANHSNDRCFRANYRAVMKHCLVQDISYYTCLEITGPSEILMEKLKMHCNPTELTFGAKIFIKGEREGTLMFYKKNGYPYCPIGHVHFLWKNDNLKFKSIWIWVHPSFYSEVLSEIISSFGFCLASGPSDEDMQSGTSQEKDKPQNQEQEFSHFRVFQNIKVPTYVNENDCQLTILRSCLNRFRLCGPFSLSIVADAFRLPAMDFGSNKSKQKKLFDSETEQEKQLNENIRKVNINEKPMDIDINKKQLDDDWYKAYYQIEENKDAFGIQSQVYNSFSTLKSPSQLPPNMVLSLTVLDPRFFLPKKRTKIVSKTQMNQVTMMTTNLANQSPLWDSSIRNSVTKSFTPPASIDNLRSQNLVPGVQNDSLFCQDTINKIPIIIIQKNGNHSNNNCVGFGSGVDIIVPVGWAMPFWLALILRCARPGGLRESKSIAYENSNFNLPMIHHPDTEAYKTEVNYTKINLTEKYFRLPPNKRTNYIKFGITSPFSCEWGLLIKEWSNVDGDSFFVLRDKNILSMLSLQFNSSLKTKRKLPQKESNPNTSINNLDESIFNKNCLVPVKVSTERKGLPKDFSIICLPTAEDLEAYKDNKKWSGPSESLKIDKNEEKRKLLRRGHLALLKRLRKQRIRAKKKVENAAVNMPVKNASEVRHINKIRQIVKKKLSNCNKTIIDQQAETMANLYLPKCTKVKNSCDREVIGYVTHGGFSYSEARGVGLGYVVMASLPHLLQQNSNIVLTRNSTTRKYRLCTLQILN